MTKTTSANKKRKQGVHYEVEISRTPPAMTNNDTSGQYSAFVNSSSSSSSSSPPINPFVSTSFHRTMDGENLSVSRRSGADPARGDSAKRDSACTLLERMLTVDDRSEEESIESLHAKACAYASTPIPYVSKESSHTTKKERNSKSNNGFDDYLSFIESQVDTNRVDYTPVSSNVVQQQREATADRGAGMALSMATTKSSNNDESDGRGLDRTEWIWDEQLGRPKRRSSSDTFTALESALMGTDEYDDEYDSDEDYGVMDVALDDTHHGRGKERGVNFRDYIEVVDFHSSPKAGPGPGSPGGPGGPTADKSLDYKPIRSKDRGMAVSTKTRDGRNNNKIKNTSNKNPPRQSILRGWNWDEKLGRPKRSTSLDSVRDLEGYLEAVESRQRSLHDVQAAEQVAAVSTKKGDGRKDSAPRESILTRWSWSKRLGRPKRRTSANQLYDIPIGSEEEQDLPDEDDAEYGIPAMFISSIQPNAREKKRRICFHYTRPMFHSKTFKISIVWVVALCVLLGSIVGIASSSRNRVNVEEEYLERVEGIEQLHGNLHHAAIMQPTSQQKNVVEKLGTLVLEDANNGNGYKIWNNSEVVVNEQEVLSTAKPDQKVTEKQNDVGGDAETVPSNVMVDLPVKEKESSYPAAPDYNKEPVQSQTIMNKVDAEAPSVVLPTNEEPPTPTVPDDTNNSEPILQLQDAKADATLTNVPNNVPTTASVATTAPEDELTQEQHLAYHAMFMKHHPRKFTRDGDGEWKGQTYAEAYEFCQDVHLIICPYEAFCPMGPKSRPYEGYEGDGGDSDLESSSQWVPVSDVTNEWVNLSEENSCVEYSAVYNFLPDWGLTGEGNEGITRHIICCSTPIDPEETTLETPTPLEAGLPSSKLTSPSAASSVTAVSESVATVSEYDPAPYVGMFKKHHPRKFTRGGEGGWEGRTYAEAYEFCKAADHIMCPYEAFCPMGPKSRPYEGYEGDAGASQWVPVSDVTNEWVNLGEENSCIEYSTVYNALPDWGLTGEGSEDITDHVMCCSTPVDPEETTLESPPSAIAPVSEYDPAPYAVMFKKHHPRKFTRGGEGGWEGRTYAEAYEFCKAADHVMCPYEAFCPMGPRSRPYNGYEGDAGASQWVPVSDVTNEWVNLSEENSCAEYSAVYNALPDWGLTGEGSEDITDHVMCCSTPVDPEETTLESPPSAIAPVSEYDPAPYVVMFKKHHPRKFTRGGEGGWEGRTYAEAYEFCKAADHVMCPYEAFCPMGPKSRPYEGHEGDAGASQWVPVSDVTNEWVNLSEENSCTEYSAVYNALPDWGLTGEGSEDITNHVMCCSTPVVPKTTLERPAPPPAGLRMSKPTPSSAVSAITTVSESSTTVLEHNLVWYDRFNGWTGQTYDEAFSFCVKQGVGYELCPFEAYCPTTDSTPHKIKDELDDGSWAPINDALNEWVRIGSDNPCVRLSMVNSNQPPAWGWTREDDGNAARYIACCEQGAKKLVPIERITDISSEHTTANDNLEQHVVEKYAPKWYDRGEASGGDWVGTSYSDALLHCARHDSSIPCPYEAYCPNGPGNAPFEGSRENYKNTRELWAPIMDIPNGWVNVGSSFDTCKLYNSLHPQPPLWGLTGHLTNEESQKFSVENVEAMTAHIMCCREPPEGSELTNSPPGPVPVVSTKHEQDILNKMHPIWFTRKHGYHGQTHEDAAAFCKNIGDMVLCPADAYCPEGNIDPDRPLFLQNRAFEGEQWAPVATTSANSDEKWLLIGELDGDSQSTCSMVSAAQEMKPEGWDLDNDHDGHLTELKEHVMCCLNPNHLLKEINFAKDLNRLWFGESFGWKGGSHDEAEEFCSKLGVNKRLCPYAAYCPHGPGQPVTGGHYEDFNMEGEQWAPVQHGSSYWVQIGQKYQNSATTCMDNWELEGQEPSWGTTNERADLKKHIMCCEY